MHLHAIPPHKVQKSPPLNVQSYTLYRSVRSAKVHTGVTEVMGRFGNSGPPAPLERPSCDQAERAEHRRAAAQNPGLGKEVN